MKTMMREHRRSSQVIVPTDDDATSAEVSSSQLVEPAEIDATGKTTGFRRCSRQFGRLAEVTAFRAFDTVNTERWELARLAGWTERAATRHDVTANRALTEGEDACRARATITARHFHDNKAPDGQLEHPGGAGSPRSSCWQYQTH